MDKIYIGYKVGMLSVVGEKQIIKNQSSWLCRCECGKEKRVLSANLRNGGTKSCGCLLIRKTTELIGKRIGHLDIIKICDNERTKNKDLMVYCRCECGRSKCIDSRGIRKGVIVTCGCKIWRWAGAGELNGDYWARLKRSADKRKIRFEITIEDAWKLALKQNKKCAYTGLDLNFTRTRMGMTASLDRIDSNKEYTLDNIQWVHRRINFMKSDMSEEVFKQFIKKIYEFKGLNNE